MDTNLKEVLIELQTQIHDLLQLQFNSTIEFNELSKKLNNDFYETYKEIYDSKTMEEAKNYLETKKFLAEEYNNQIDENMQSIAKSFDKRLDDIHDNLEKIKETF